jgi:N-acetyl-alpha-D-muramate 1-phosphate uridylyltransferase
MLPCAILCGGLATRLRPLTEKIPKSLISIHGEPFIAHQLRLLRTQGITRVVLCTGFLSEMIADFVGSGSRFGVDISICSDGARPLGTAGSVRNALPLLGPSFFVLYGDSYLPCDYRAIEAAFSRSGAPALMTIYRNDGSYDSSNVEAVDGRILRYEKGSNNPALKYIDYGLGVFDRSAFERTVDPDLTHVYQELLTKGELAAFEVKERFYEVGSSPGIKDLETYLIQNA